jgi:hypothetical protein
MRYQILYYGGDYNLWDTLTCNYTNRQLRKYMSYKDIEIFFERLWDDWFPLNYSKTVEIRGYRAVMDELLEEIRQSELIFESDSKEEIEEEFRNIIFMWELSK